MKGLANSRPAIAPLADVTLTLVVVMLAALPMLARDALSLQGGSGENVEALAALELRLSADSLWIGAESFDGEEWSDALAAALAPGARPVILEAEGVPVQRVVEVLDHARLHGASALVLSGRERE